MAGAVWLFSLPLIAGGAEKVVFVDNSWDSIQVLNRIAGFLLEKGYGFQAEYLFAETLPGLMGVERGEAQVIMEVWVDNYGDWYEKARERHKIVSLGENYPGAPQGWYIPAYVVKGDPQRGIEPLAPDLEYIQDLPKYWKLFQSPEVPEKGAFLQRPHRMGYQHSYRDQVQNHRSGRILRGFLSRLRYGSLHRCRRGL